MPSGAHDHRRGLRGPPCPFSQARSGSACPQNSNARLPTNSRRFSSRSFMSRSELGSPQHLQKKALIYIRQSSPHQVLTNQESLRLQYALQQRAQDLGWRPEDIEVIDADLGVTGRSTQGRDGFKEVVAQVTLGQVGIILSSEVQGLSRNCSDW